MLRKFGFSRWKRRQTGHGRLWRRRTHGHCRLSQRNLVYSAKPRQQRHDHPIRFGNRYSDSRQLWRRRPQRHRGFPSERRQLVCSEIVKQCVLSRSFRSKRWQTRFVSFYSVNPVIKHVLSRAIFKLSGVSSNVCSSALRRSETVLNSSFVNNLIS